MGFSRQDEGDQVVDIVAYVMDVARQKQGTGETGYFGKKRRSEKSSECIGADHP